MKGKIRFHIKVNWNTCLQKWKKKIVAAGTDVHSQLEQMISDKRFTFLTELRSWIEALKLICCSHQKLKCSLVFLLLACDFLQLLWGCGVSFWRSGSWGEEKNRLLRQSLVWEPQKHITQCLTWKSCYEGGGWQEIVVNAYGIPLCHGHYSADCELSVLLLSFPLQNWIRIIMSTAM